MLDQDCWHDGLLESCLLKTPTWIFGRLHILVLCKNIYKITPIKQNIPTLSLNGYPNRTAGFYNHKDHLAAHVELLML